MMPPSPRFPREEVHVLADPTEVRIVVLGHQRNAQWTLIRLEKFQVRQVRERGVITTRAPERSQG